MTVSTRSAGASKKPPPDRPSDRFKPTWSVFWCRSCRRIYWHADALLIRTHSHHYGVCRLMVVVPVDRGHKTQDHGEQLELARGRHPSNIGPGSSWE